MKWIRALFGSRNDRILKRLQQQVVAINACEDAIKALSDEALAQQTQRFREQLAAGASLDQLLPSAFATMREACWRTLGMRHFDVQLMGGIVLHEGNIAEMRTGEGKTLVGTLPAYLNALTGQGVHFVTVNDYLAARDAAWMRPAYEAVGLSVAVNVPSLDRQEKQAAYQCDILYGTNNEFGFDYLRDNMAFSPAELVQRPLNFALVDEADSVFIDEARTPLIISGAAEDSSALYQQLDTFMPTLTPQITEDGPGDYVIDEKMRQVHLTEHGHQQVEDWLVQQALLRPGESVYDVNHISLMHHIMACLRAHTLYQRDVHYIVRQQQVMIVDEHTGRTLAGRRWSDGLHQAVEAKERVPIQPENQTLATVTLQNYFRLYPKYAGMTGTADTEAFEFKTIYDKEVVVIPTHRPTQRTDHPDLVYLTKAEKNERILADIRACREQQQPVLVGTASIEASETVSEMLHAADIPHRVLNAKFHDKEAQIIAEAGRPGAVTIATNMAGRGTDIVLGGNLEAELQAITDPAEQAQCRVDWQQRHDLVLAAGGLHIMGTERHESRRIDNQLRGRAGRQGDPGSSRFYLSLEDDLMRIFASDRVASLMERLGMGQGEPIEHRMVSKAIENAQRKVEGFNFDVRKQLLEYDDIANEQRKVVYAQRAEIMAVTDLGEMIDDIRADSLQHLVAEYVPPDTYPTQWDLPGLTTVLRERFAVDCPLEQWVERGDPVDHPTLVMRLQGLIAEAYAAKMAPVNAEAVREVEKSLLLQALDHHWKEHLATMDYLRQGIHLRGYAQKNPKQEYKRESFELFSRMKVMIKQDVTSMLALLELREEEPEVELQPEPPPRAWQPVSHGGDTAVLSAPPKVQAVPVTQKIGRNALCPCGSGRKYKHCHGRLAV